MNGMTERDVRRSTRATPTSGRVLGVRRGRRRHVEPAAAAGAQRQGAALVFDSSKIPGEIIDMMVVRTNAPEANPDQEGADRRVVRNHGHHDRHRQARARTSARRSWPRPPGTVAEYKAQLATTAMFYKPAEAVAFAKGPQRRRRWSTCARSATARTLRPARQERGCVGIAFPDGSRSAIAKNVKLRFTADYMKHGGRRQAVA